MSHFQYTEGTSKFGEYTTWWRSCGNLKGGITPVVIVHGGPWYATSDYLFELQDLLAFHAIPTILYDQLGNGRSTRLPDKTGTDGQAFWTMTLFKDQLSNLIEDLFLGSYHLWGHSWGGMLVQEFALDKDRSQGLKKLILHSTVAARSDWDAQVEDQRNSLPAKVLTGLKGHENGGTTDSEEYKALVQDEYYTRYVCRTEPAPASLEAAATAREADSTVSDALIGSSIFFCSGTLKDWSAVDRLGQIDVPTLLIDGEYDSVGMLPLFKGIPKAKWVTIPGSSHIAHLEEPGKVQKAAAEFLLD